MAFWRNRFIGTGRQTHREGQMPAWHIPLFLSLSLQNLHGWKMEPTIGTVHITWKGESSIIHLVLTVKTSNKNSHLAYNI